MVEEKRLFKKLANFSGSHVGGGGGGGGGGGLICDTLR